MVVDYKGVSFSFDKIKRKKRIQRFRLIGLGVILIFLAILLFLALDTGKIQKVRTLLLEGKPAEAAAYLDHLGSSFHPDSKKELKALVHLFSHEYSKAQEILGQIAGKSTTVDPWKFLAYFSDAAEYRGLGMYCDYLGKKKAPNQENEDFPFYNLLAKIGGLDYPGAAAIREQLPSPLKKKHEKAMSLLGPILDQLKAGKINYIFDIEGVPLAYYDIRKKTTVSLTPGISFEEFTPGLQGGIKFYHLTLDRRVQEKVHRLFRDLHGSFLLMKVEDSGIAAAYSKPWSPGSLSANPVFSETYEPGSIIKLLTLLTYLKSSSNRIFPLQCEGMWTIDPKSREVFYDWMVHHRVVGFEEALAVSCNIAFAKMGIQVGFGMLSEILREFFFNSDSRALSDLFLSFKTGSFNTGIPPTASYRLAQLSVGLKEISITTFHAALISAIISQDGSIYAPYLVKNKKNLLNLAFYNHPPRLMEVLKANTIFLQIKKAMKLVVDSPNGTGKRSRVEFVTVALKTGTAGSKESGLDAVLTGFFPADKPQYAFAFRLERAGKAEWQGALFLKDFLTAFYSEELQITR